MLRRSPARAPVTPRLEIREHPAAAEQHADVVTLAALEGLAIDVTGEIHGDPVAIVALAVHGYELWTLRAQVLDHRIDIGVGDLRSRPGHGEPIDLPQLDLWKHFEDGAVSEVLARRSRKRLDARTGGGAQFLLVDRLGKARLHEVREHFLADLCTVLLPYYLERYLPRTEALELGRAADALQALVDGLLDPFARDADFHPALEGAGRFDRNLHAQGSWSRRQ